MKKPVFYSEIAYLLGTFLLALGTAMLVFGNFGVSMVVAPAFVLHMKLSAVWSWFSFGVAEYLLQGVLLLVVWLLLKGKKLSCLLSFVAALIYGLILDGAMWLVGLLPGLLAVRIVVYVIGVLMCTAALSFLFHSYLPPAAYELLVITAAGRVGGKLTTWKTVYDCSSLLVAVILSYTLFGEILGVGIGTVICALIYGTLIGMFGKLWDRLWDFQDRYPHRPKFN